MSLDFFVNRSSHETKHQRPTAALDGTTCKTSTEAAAFSRELK